VVHVAKPWSEEGERGEREGRGVMMLGVARTPGLRCLANGAQSQGKEKGRERKVKEGGVAAKR